MDLRFPDRAYELRMVDVDEENDRFVYYKALALSRFGSLSDMWARRRMQYVLYMLYAKGYLVEYNAGTVLDAVDAGGDTIYKDWSLTKEGRDYLASTYNLAPRPPY